MEFIKVMLYLHCYLQYIFMVVLSIWFIQCNIDVVVTNAIVATPVMHHKHVE